MLPAHNASLSSRRNRGGKQGLADAFFVAHAIPSFFLPRLCQCLFATKDYIAEHGLQYMLCPPVKRADGLPLVNGI